MSSNCPKINPCVTLALTAVQEEIFPLSATLCLLLLKKSLIMFSQQITRNAILD